MKSRLKYTTPLLVILVILSCNNSEKKTSNSSTDEKITKMESMYSIDTSGTHIIWTAYKFAAKVGVKGKLSCTQYALKGEVAFFLYNAAIVFHSSAMENMSKEVENKMNESIWCILIHNWY